MSDIPRTDHITALSDWPAIGKYSCLADVTSEANHLLKKEKQFSSLISIQCLCEKYSFCLILAKFFLQWTNTYFYSSKWVKFWIVTLGSLQRAKYLRKGVKRQPSLEWKKSILCHSKRSQEEDCFPKSEVMSTLQISAKLAQVVPAMSYWGQYSGCQEELISSNESCSMQLYCFFYLSYFAWQGII